MVELGVIAFHDGISAVKGWPGLIHAEVQRDQDHCPPAYPRRPLGLLIVTDPAAMRTPSGRPSRKAALVAIL